MTIETEPRPTILRRGIMDERDAAICRAVWWRWRIGRYSGAYDVTAAAGLSSTSVYHYHVMGTHGAYRRVGGGLVKRGWLSKANTYWRVTRTLRPGPRFVGLDASGWPLEAV